MDSSACSAVCPIDQACWVQEGSPVDIYCDNFDDILEAVQHDGAVSRNDVENVRSSLEKIKSVVNSELFVQLCQMPGEDADFMDTKHVKTDVLSVWSTGGAKMRCSFLAKKDACATFVKRHSLLLCVADQVLELLLKCSDMTKTTACRVPDCVIQGFDYVNVVAAVMGINLVRSGRPLYERVIFFQLCTEKQAMGPLLLPKIKSGTLPLANLGLLHEQTLVQLLGIYTSDFLTHLGSMMDRHKKTSHMQQEMPCIKLY